MVTFLKLSVHYEWGNFHYYFTHCTIVQCYVTVQYVIITNTVNNTNMS